MHELVINLHIHTHYSDGTGRHADVAAAAAKAGLDAVIVTDHNVWVRDKEGYYQVGDKRVLVLVGEEIHNQARDPQKSHMLVYGANRELATFAPDPQNLIDQVRRSGGVCFLAHPYEDALPEFGETDIGWDDWHVHGFTGIELWNGFSEFKTVVNGYPSALFYAFNPHHMAHGPHPDTLRKWDELTRSGERVVAVGGSDSHALRKHLGPLKKTIFPYEFHFQAVNTHLLTPTALTGDVSQDRRMIIEALTAGHAWVGYDLPEATRGFRFTATGRDKTAIMGDEIQLDEGVTLQAKLPARAPCRLICDGKVLQTWTGREVCAFTASEPGVYRFEAAIDFLNRRRGWIYSNPIYVRPARLQRVRAARPD